MLRMRKKETLARDMLGQLELPFLWPDKDGALSLKARYHARSSGLPLRHLPRSPRGEVRRALRMLQSQSLSSWLLSKSFRVVGFGTVVESLFEMWLCQQLESCDFNAQTLVQVARDAAEELDLERGEILRLLVKATRRGGKFRSDGVIITKR
jgi:hypothetical protein